MKTFFFYSVIFSTVAIAKATLLDEQPNLVWFIGQPINEIVGPKNAIYCRVSGPGGFIYYQGFGRCEINLNRASSKHEGVWNLRVGLADRVLTEDSSFNVTIVYTEPDTKVTTHVEVEESTVTLICSVSSTSDIAIKSCAFSHLSNRLLVANKVVEEDRYTYHVTDVSHGEFVTQECGLTITEPVVKDLGFWRCAVNTEGNVYYGFLTFLYPGIYNTITEPRLMPLMSTVVDIAGNSVSMKCSIYSAIRYCYFRHSNGTTFDIGPGFVDDQATYVGAGFQAGECGIRFSNLAVTDAGDWSCHVGLVNETAREERANFTVTILDPMTLLQRVRGTQLIIETQVNDYKSLDYCRFVRNDGYGFTTDNFPPNYINLSSLSEGQCGIIIDSPSTIERQPWTIVAKAKGQRNEISAVSQFACADLWSTFLLPSIWILLFLLGLTLLSISFILLSKKSKGWNFRRVAAIRNSIRRTTVENLPEKNTANVT